MYTVITVDDEPIIKKVLQKLLPESGLFRIIAEAEDGLEALKLVRALSPDLLISDIRMPVMDGLELAEALYKERIMPEMLFLSGYDDSSYVRRAMPFGVKEYLLKPLDPSMLAESLQGVVERLQAKRHIEADDARLLAACSQTGAELAAKMEALQTEEACSLLSGFCRRLEAEGLAPARVQSLLSDLWGFASSALADRGGFEPLPASPERLERASAHESHEAPYAEFIRRWIEARQVSRNWGAYRHVRQMAQYLEQHYASPSLSLQQLADQLGMSVSYLSRSFKEEWGMSFSAYLTTLRMELAKTLLRDPVYKTSDIASQVGYTDLPHFTKSFKKYTGLNPSDFRKRLGAR
ncbi:helix-turn-helix domain-containing protein [Paenibacillus koleovorans]|uniref:helix-turn-helix domain-containing protein n=1 Tax=Paenibacillus koleovorans TaxID=121608 RepID=UPI000FDCC4A2|nr:helix-turn-helix domain-containing protein [Paenibacillus koleovorans]